MSLRHSLIAALVGSLALLHVTAWAGSPTERLRPALEEVIRVLNDPSLKPAAKATERQDLVRAAVVDLFDFPEMARRTLALHWRALREPKRDEFTRLFRALLEHTYLPKIALYKGKRVRFVGESVDGELATVQSLVITHDGKEVPVAYRLRERDGSWLVYDISVEGISLTSNYRSQFNAIVQRSSYQELVRRIKQRLAAPPSEDSLEALGAARRK